MENKKDLKWANTPEPPVPGLYYMDMIPEIDYKTHDSSIDELHLRIHTEFNEFFPIDYMEEIRKLTNSSNESWLRQNKQIDEEYYRNQIERMDCIRRYEENTNIEDVFDYQSYLKESFTNINDELEGYEIEEEYPLFPSLKEEYFLAYGDIEEGNEFYNKKVGSSLVDTCLINEKEHELVKQSCNDNIIIEIQDGVAYYSEARFIFKIKKIEK